MRATVEDWKQPDYTAVYRERRERLRKIRTQCGFAAACATFYRTSPVEFIEDWAYTYDPRLVARNLTPTMPFILFPRQQDLVRWIQERGSKQEDGVVEKSRDVGISWIIAAYAVWQWLFHSGAAIGFGSYEQIKVDRIGVPDSLLEKCRIIIRHLPEEMKPPNLNEGDRGHLMHMRLVNPANGSTIVGEVGDDIGRGARATLYFVDEAAFLARPEMVDAALMATTESCIHLSTAHGTGPFYKKVVGGSFPVFRFHWRDDPRKDEAWYASICKRLDPAVVAQEVDIDHVAAVEDVIIEAKWVEAARRIRDLVDVWPVYADGFGGLDVGGGTAKSVFVARFGPFVDAPISWRDGDTTNTAHRAIKCAEDAGISVLNFDAIGIGQGVQSVFRRHRPTMLRDEKGRQWQHVVKTNGVSIGDPAGNDVWPSGRRSHQMFSNLKAEVWWKMRQRFQATYEHVRYLETDGAEGTEHPLDDLIVLPTGSKAADDLARELSSPTADRQSNGKLKVESKESMKRTRGLDSPDHAEALSLTFVPRPAAIKAKDLEGFY